MSNKKINYRLLNEINKIHFCGFYNCRCGNALGTVNYYFDYNNIPKVKELVRKPLFGNVYTKKGNVGNNLFVFSHSYLGREDIKRWFTKVFLLIPNSIALFAKLSNKKLFSIKEKFLIFVWIMQMRNVKCSIKEKLYYCNYMICGLRNISFVKNVIKKNKVKIVTTVCDVMPMDYFIIDYCNKIGIKTVTLQHGFFDPDMELGRYAYTFSTSKYFLTYSHYTKQIGIKLGIKGSKLIPVGLPNNIGLNDNYWSKPNTIQKNFLIVLDGPILKKYNEKMLGICYKFAEMYDYFFDVKVHPAENETNKNIYKRLIKNRGNILKNKYQNKHFFFEYSFGIMHNTTMIIEAVYRLFPIYIYRENNLLYQKIGVYCFDDEKELYELVSTVSEIEMHNKLKAVRDFTCGRNIEQNYIEFFAKQEHTI